MTAMSAPARARRRFARPVALVAVALGSAATLAACSKPLPDVTFQSGSRSVLAAPSSYCWDISDKGSCHGSKEQKKLTATPGGVIQISVPRTVADQAWIATAYSVGADGKTTPLDGFGSNLISDNHFGRVFVPTRNGSYLLAVNEFRGDTQTGTWTVQIDITASA